jgi:receptor tyrosine kinase-like orphan receptor 1
VSQLVQPHTCFANYGREYRGTVSTTKTGLICLPWNQKTSISTSGHVELMGGHNFCRNPSFDQASIL